MRFFSNQAALHDAQGRYKEAEPFYRRALGILEKAPGLDNWEIVKTLSNMAALYEKMGKPKEATGFAARARAIGRGWRGESRRDSAHPRGQTLVGYNQVIWEIPLIAGRPERRLHRPFPLHFFDFLTAISEFR